MKRFYSGLIILMFVIFGSFYEGQAQTVTFASGIDSTTESDVSPVNMNNRYFHFQMIYTAKELNAKGIYGPIYLKQFGFYVLTNPYLDLPEFTISMGHTTDTNVANHQNVNFTEVYYRYLYSPKSHGFDTLTLDKLFLWNGQDNIVVDICYGEIQPFTMASGNVRIDSIQNGLRYYSSYYDICGTTTFYTENYRPQAVMVFRPSPSDDAGLLAFSSPNSPFDTSSQNVKVTLKNNGKDTLKSVKINWEVNSVAQTVYNWSGALSPNDTAHVKIGTTKISVSGAVIKSWTSMPNGKPDSNANNDTIRSGMLFPALSGTYTIGGTSPDFKTIREAVNHLNSGGVIGPVVFKIRNGSYNEHIIISQISGASSTNTITFTSESGDSSLVVITGTSNSSDSNFVFLLNGADYINFNHLTIVSSGSTYGRVIVLQNDADNIDISNNSLSSSSPTSTGTNFAIIYSVGTNDSLHIKNNLIEKGSYGLYGSGSTPLSMDLIIANNLFRNLTYAGIYVSYHLAPFIFHNQIFGNASSFFYGIYLYRCDKNLNILRNLISKIPDGYGILLYYCYGDTANVGLTANNFIDLNGPSTMRGIFIYNSTYQNIFHNNVNTFGNNTSSSAFYTYYSSMISLLNNCFSNPAGGYAIYSYSTGELDTSDNNNLFTTGMYLGYQSNNYMALSDWKTGTGYDSNSISKNPYYTKNIDLHVNQVDMKNAGNPIAGISDDFDGETRNSTPDIGADEFTLASLDAGIIAIDSPSIPLKTGAHNIYARLKNLGGTTITSVTINWSINGVLQTSQNWTGSLPSGKEVSIKVGSDTFAIGTGKKIVAWTSSPNSSADANTSNDTASAGPLYPGLSGTYTIGGTSPDFANFTDAINALNQGGVYGAVDFEVRSGTYSEQIVIQGINGASPTNTVIFKSESGDSTDVKLTYSSSNSAASYTVLLNGASFIRFHQITIEAGGSSYARVIELQTSANDIRFSNCILQGNSASTSSTYSAIIYSTSIPMNALEFVNNRFIEGSYGIYLYGQSNNYATETRIERNLFERNYYMGIYLYYQVASQIIQNQIIASLYTYYIGIYLYSNIQNYLILKNTIFGFQRYYGIYLYYCYGDASHRAIVANNFIQGGDTYGGINIYAYNCTFISFYFNNLLNISNSTSSAAFNLLYGSDLVLMNNIAAHTGAGYAINTTSGTIASSDYNDLFSNGTLGNYSGTDAPDLSQWRTLSSMDSSSKEVDPLYKANDDLHVSQSSLKGAGMPILGIIDDIDGEPRDSVAPDIGADEFYLPAADAGISGFSSPKSPFSSGTLGIKAILKNYGNDTLKSVTINWKFGGVSQTSLMWTGSLKTGDTAHITLGSKTFSNGTAYNYVAWTSSPNSTTDTVPENDTSQVNNVYTGLSGTYTIGGSSPDFPNFREAARALNLGGVVGPVTFNVRNGTYYEHITLNQIVGASATNTITFQSQNGDSSLVEINYTASYYDSNYTVLLDGSDFIIFHQITITGSNSSYGTAVLLMNGANNNHFTNCRLRSNGTTSSNSSLAVIYITDDEIDTGNIFFNNAITSGSYGIYINNSDEETGTVIKHNIFKDQYYSGIYARYQSSILITENIISTSSPGTFLGIYLYYCQDSSKITKNKITGISYGYGIYCYSFNGYPARGLIANNFVQIGNTSTAYGIRVYYCDYMDIVFNSVNVTSSSTSSYAFYCYYGSNINVLNNIFYCESGYSSYVYPGSQFSRSDFNDFKTDGSNFIYNSNYYTDLSSYQKGTNLDSNSLSYDPLFNSTTDLHTTQSLFNGMGIPFKKITTDIDNEKRSSVSPDIGADEFRAIGNDAGILAVNSPSVPFNAGSQTVKVELKNFGNNNLSSVTINWKVNGISQSSVSWSGTLNPDSSISVSLGSFTFLSDSTYIITSWTSAPNSGIDSNIFNDSFTTDEIFAALSGTYTIGGSSPDFPDFSAAIEALNKGGVAGQVTFEVRSGTYNEQIEIGEIAGASATNNILFISEDKDSTMVILSYNSSYNDNFIVKIDGGSYIKFHQITFEATYYYYARIFELNDASEITISNCVLRGSNYSSTTDYTTLIYGYSTDLNNIKILNNELLNGSRAVYFYGQGYDEALKGIEINHNNISNQYYCGLQIYYSENSKITNNQIHSTNFYSYGYGIDIEYGIHGLEIMNNDLRNLPFENGLYLYYIFGQVNNPVLIANNFISLTGPYYKYGLYLYNVYQANVYHNSVNIAKKNSYNSYAFYNNYGKYQKVLNNIFSDETGGIAFYSYNSEYLNSDYNDIFTNGSILGYYDGSNISDLADWQNATSMDFNSLSVDPAFVNDTDLHTSQISLNNIAYPLSEITDDIDGDLRSSTPDIGADEFNPPAVDAGISNIDSPEVAFAAGLRNLKFSLKNFGLDTLKSAVIKWEINGGSTNSYNWSGKIPSGDTEVVNVGSYNFSAGTFYNIIAWSESPNSLTDTINRNDTTIADSLFPALSGTYTVGGSSPDFSTLGDAAMALKYGGVIGPVTFQLRTGSFNEQIVLGNIKGASASNKIIFESESHDSTKVIISYGYSYSNNFLVRFNNAQYIEFRQLSFRPTNFSYSRIFDFTGTSNNITISNNMLNGSNSSTSNYLALIYGYSDDFEYITIQNNIFNEGSYGIYLLGSGNNKGIVIKRNIFKNQYYSGTYLYQLNSPMFIQNHVSSNSTYSSYYCLQLYSVQDEFKILNNTIINKNGYTGIYVSYGGNNINKRGLIANNFVYVGGSGTGFGLYLYQSNYVDILHNSIHVTNTDESNGRGVYLYYGSNLEFWNNIFVNSGGGYAIYTTSSSNISGSDYNDFYTDGQNFGYWNGDRTNLNEWRNASLMDGHSISVDPQFKTDSNLHVVSALLNNAGKFVSTVTDDIDGDTRNTSKPDIGADEFDIAAYDAAIMTIDSPVTPFLSSAKNIYVTFLNNGSDTLDSLVISWSVNGSLQSPFKWIGSLASGKTTQVNIGSFYFGTGNGYTIKVWSSSPNGMSDTVNTNDTLIEQNVYPTLGGVYTIGGTSPDFNSFSEAITALNYGGVYASVTFNVRSGTYNEQLVFTKINGVSQTNTITFQSQSGDSTDVVLNYSSSNYDSNFTVQFNNASYITFSKMTLQASGGSYTIVVDITNSSSDLNFKSNIFKGYPYGSTSTYHALVYSSSYTDNNLTFQGNKFVDGSYGLYLNGTSSGSLESGLSIVNNLFTNQYYMGVYLRYMNAPHIISNEINSSTSYSGYYGIYLYYCDNNIHILKNKFNIKIGTFGIRIQYCDGTSSNRGIIANNFIYVGGSTSAYGIYKYYCGYFDIYNNNINIASSYLYGYALYNYYGSNCNIINNNFINKGTGYAYYISDLSSITNSDYNNLYVTGSYLGDYSGAQSNLSDWQSNTGFDAHSVSIDPLYVSSTNLHVKQIGLNEAGTPVSEVTDDIDGEPRNTTTPDIGADEFEPLFANDAGIDKIISPDAPFNKGLNNVKVILKNYGSDTLKNVTINWKANDTARTTANWTGALATGDTQVVIISSFNFHFNTWYDLVVWTTNPNSVSDSLSYNDTASKLNLVPALSGTYTIGGFQPDFYDFTEAASVLNFGGVTGNVTFNARNGTYTEQVTFNKIIGASASNKIKFQSENGDSSKVTLTYGNANSTNNFTVRLNNTSYLQFHQLTLASSSNSYNQVIELIGENNNLTFTNNRINNKTTASTSYNNALLSSDNSYKEDIKIENNLFENGSYAIRLYGSSSLHLTGIEIKDNFFKNQYYQITILQYIDALELESNSFESLSNYNYATGAYLYQCDGKLKVIKNKFSLNSGTGLLLYYCNGTYYNRGLIANNQISIDGNSYGRGIYSYASTYQNIVYNNVNIYNSFYNSYSAQFYYGNNNNLLNNNLILDGNGYALYLSSLSILFRSNYNNFYTNGSTLAYYNGDISNLSGWKSATQFDSNSVSTDPIFTSNTDLHASSAFINNAGTPFSGVTDDYDGETRNTTNPDIGSDEFAPVANDVGVQALISPVNGCNLDTAEEVTIKVLNYGGNSQSNFDVAYRIGNGTPVVETITGPLTSGNSVNYTFTQKADLSNNQTYYFTAYTLLSNDSNSANDTLSSLPVTSYSQVAAVSNLVPVDSSKDEGIPVHLSWFPASGATSYDLYLWDTTKPKPTNPTIGNLTKISVDYSNVNYGKTYKWQIVSRNICSDTFSAIQTFTIKELPDLVVDSVSVPKSGFSGQSFTISWIIKNQGNGKTGSQTWYDLLYLSTDNVFDVGDTYLGGVSNFSSLNAGQTYKNSTSFSLPHGISGTYYFFVVTDKYSHLTETNENNNVSASSKAVNVKLTPPPDLIVSSIIKPSTAFSGQSINITWTVKNDGTGITNNSTWFDRIYLTKDTVLDLGNATHLGTFKHSGDLAVDSSYTTSTSATIPISFFGRYYIHIITDATNLVYEHASESNNTTVSDSLQIILTPPPDLVVTSVTAPDSASNNEKVTIYWSVENIGGSAPIATYWFDRIYISDTPAYDPNKVSSVGTETRSSTLNPNQTYNASRVITIPDNIKGPYYFYVHTDYSNRVFEYQADTNNITRSDTSTEIINPDLEIVEIEAPKDDSSGNIILVSWTQKNNGPGQLASEYRTDAIFLSSYSTFDPDSAIILGSKSVSTGLLKDDSLDQSINITLPNGLSGIYYIYIFSDYSGNIYEANENNNISYTSINVTLKPWPDLKVTSINNTDTATAGDLVLLNFEVLNDGFSKAAGSAWKDKIYILDDTVWNASHATFLGEFTRILPLYKDSSYKVMTSVSIPSTLQNGQYYIFVETDQENKIYEHTDENNNRSHSPLYVKAYPPIDLDVIALEAPDSTATGKTIKVKYTTKNIGTGNTLAGYWYDAVYLSLDSNFSSLNDQLLKSWKETRSLAYNQQYTDSQMITIPNNNSGTYYLFLVTDYSDLNNDFNFNNNSEVVRKSGIPSIIKIKLTAPPDLVVSSMTVPASGVSGQPVRVKFTAKNDGTGPTVSGSWTDKIYLSTDLVLNSGDYPLGTKVHTGNLSKGQSYNDSLDITIPSSVSGNYIIILSIDDNKNVYEHTNEGNNTGYSPISITQPPPSDLVVSSITIPDSAIAGQKATFSWKIKNTGSNPATGYMRDAVYLSLDTVWDINDALIGTYQNSISLLPNGETSRSLTQELTGVAPGDYSVIIRTDVLDNIIETNDTNNTSHSIDTINVDVTKLPLHVLTPDTLFNNKELYYRIEIDDTLQGESMLLTLKGDSINGANELYLRYSDVATRSTHDYSYTNAFSGNQEIVVPKLKKGTYYLLVYGSKLSGGSYQNITLYAKILKFEIRSVNTNKGGNTGKVTVLIDGSKFDSTTTFELQGNSVTVTGSNVLLIDPTQAYVTFDLRGRPLGKYSLVARKSTGDTAALVDGFEVEKGKPASLLTNITKPGSTRPNRIITVSIEFTNGGNTDIVNPEITLLSLASAPIGLNVSALSQNNTALKISLEEPGGPPGILRPGYSGTITVYAVSKQALSFLIQLPDLK